MTVDEIFTLARREAGVSATEYTDAILLPYLNFYYHRLRKIQEQFLKEDYRTTIDYLDAIATPAYYDISSKKWYKISKISIKPYITSDYYVPATELNYRSDQHSLDWYLENQSASDPKYLVLKNSLYIFPQFVTDTINGVDNNQIECLVVPYDADLADNGAENTIILTTDYHYGLVLGVKIGIFRLMKSKGDISIARAEYLAFEGDFLKELTDKTDDNMIATIPDDTNLQ